MIIGPPAGTGTKGGRGRKAGRDLCTPIAETTGGKPCLPRCATEVASGIDRLFKLVGPHAYRVAGAMFQAYASVLRIQYPGLCVACRISVTKPSMRVPVSSSRTGKVTSIRRYRWCGIRPAPALYSVDSPALHQQYARGCSGIRAMIERTRIVRAIPGTPGRRQLIPRNRRSRPDASINACQRVCNAFITVGASVLIMKRRIATARVLRIVVDTGTQCNDDRASSPVRAYWPGIVDARIRAGEVSCLPDGEYVRSPADGWHESMTGGNDAYR